MLTTTIQIDIKTKEKLKSFGNKGETYQDIINKLYDIAVKQQLRELLLSAKNSLSPDEARKRLKKWQQ